MNSSKLIGLNILAFLFWLTYPVTVPAASTRAEITHLVIKNSKDFLRVDLKIDSEFTSEMKAAVLNGVPIRFTISVNLYEVKDFWFDRKAAATTVIHELRYDALKKVYKLTSSRGIRRPIYIEDFGSARRHISEINNLAVTAFRNLKKGAHYQLMVGAVLSIKKFPLLNLFHEFESDRYTVNFIY